MSKKALEVKLIPEDKASLQRWAGAPATEQRLTLRVDIVLAAAEPGTFSLFALAIVSGLGALWVERRRKLSRCAIGDVDITPPPAI